MTISGKMNGGETDSPRAVGGTSSQRSFLHRNGGNADEDEHEDVHDELSFFQMKLQSSEDV